MLAWRKSHQRGRPVLEDATVPTGAASASTPTTALASAITIDGFVNHATQFPEDAVVRVNQWFKHFVGEEAGSPSAPVAIDTVEATVAAWDTDADDQYAGVVRRQLGVAVAVARAWLDVRRALGNGELTTTAVDGATGTALSPSGFALQVFLDTARERKWMVHGNVVFQEGPLGFAAPVGPVAATMLGIVTDTSAQVARYLHEHPSAAASLAVSVTSGSFVADCPCVVVDAAVVAFLDCHVRIVSGGALLTQPVTALNRGAPVTPRAALPAAFPSGPLSLPLPPAVVRVLGALVQGAIARDIDRWGRVLVLVGPGTGILATTIKTVMGYTLLPYTDGLTTVPPDAHCLYIDVGAAVDLTRQQTVVTLAAVAARVFVVLRVDGAVPASVLKTESLRLAATVVTDEDALLPPPGAVLVTALDAYRSVPLTLLRAPSVLFAQEDVALRPGGAGTTAVQYVMEMLQVGTQGVTLQARATTTWDRVAGAYEQYCVLRCGDPPPLAPTDVVDAAQRVRDVIPALRTIGSTVSWDSTTGTFSGLASSDELVKTFPMG
jgi:hypothetical protein